MHVCLTLLCVPACAEVEDSVFALMELLEGYCDSISTCDVSVEGVRGDLASQTHCTVRLALQVFGERIDVTGHSSLSSDDTPLQSALHSTYRDAIPALQALARTHQGCSCHDSLVLRDRTPVAASASNPVT
jgi:hypothetical protein